MESTGATNKTKSLYPLQHALSDRQYLEARRFLSAINKMDPEELLRSTGFQLYPKRIRSHTLLGYQGVRTSGVYRDKTFFTKEFTIPYCENLCTFTARITGDSSRAISQLVEQYPAVTQRYIDAGQDELLNCAATLLDNIVQIEDLVRNGFRRTAESRLHRVNWSQFGNVYKALQKNPRMRGALALLTQDEIKRLGWRPVGYDFSVYTHIPVLVFYTDYATVGEIRLPASIPTSWRYICGKSVTASSIPAFAPVAFAGLRTFSPMEFNEEPKVYLEENFFVDGLYRYAGHPPSLLMGSGNSLEFAQDAVKERTVRHVWADRMLSSPPRVARCFSSLKVGLLEPDCIAETSSAYNRSVRYDYWLANQIELICKAHEPGRAKECLEDLFLYNYMTLREEEYVCKYLQENLPPDLYEMAMELLDHAQTHSVTAEEKRVVLDSKNTLLLKASGTGIISENGVYTEITNFSIKTLYAILFEGDLSPSHYYVRAYVGASSVDCLLGKQSLSSPRQLVSGIKYQLEEDAVDYSPVISDATYVSKIMKYWLSEASKVPLKSGVDHLGFHPTTGKFSFPGMTLDGGLVRDAEWVPHPSISPLSYFRPIAPPKQFSMKCLQRPITQILTAYTVSCITRFYLGWKPEPLVLRDTAYNRSVTQDYFESLGQMGPMTLRLTDGAGVYKKIFSSLHGYPLLCLGSARSIEKIIRGPAVVLDPEHGVSFTPDTLLDTKEFSSSIPATLLGFLQKFMEDPRAALSVMSQEINPEKEGRRLLGLMLQNADLWTATEESYPLFNQLLLDIPQENLHMVFRLQDGDNINIEPASWSVSRRELQKELAARFTHCEFMGTSALQVGPVESLYEILSQFYGNAITAEDLTPPS